MGEVAFEQDAAVKETKFANYSKTVFPDFLEKLNALIEKNNGYLALGKVNMPFFNFYKLLAFARGFSKVRTSIFARFAYCL